MQNYETLMVVSFLIEQGDKILIVQEQDEDIRGSWNLPGGKVEPDETIQAAIDRELFEETGRKASNLSVEYDFILEWF
jgi:ADP-ribose pyrophosphatase YjhB (NUDIX family)